jgi:hypothetical protein
MRYSRSSAPRWSESDIGPAKLTSQSTRLHGRLEAVGYAKFFSCSQGALIRVFDETGNVIETHEHAGDFKEW